MTPEKVNKNGRSFLIDNFGGWVPFTDQDHEKEVIISIKEGHPHGDMLIPYILGASITAVSGQPMTQELIARIEKHLGECYTCYMATVSLMQIE